MLLVSLFLSVAVPDQAWQTLPLESEERIGLVAQNSVAKEADALRLVLTNNRKRVVVLSKLVADSLGSSDAAVATRCAKYGVKKVAILRGTPEHVTLALYSTSGDKLTETSWAPPAPAATPSPAAAPPPVAPAPVTPPAVKAGAASNPTPPPAKEDASDVVNRILSGKDGKETAPLDDEDFQNRALIYQDITFIWANTGMYAGSYARVYQGKHLRPIDWSEFYQIVARPDLQERYENRRALRLGLGLGGLGIAIAGAIMAPVGLAGLLGNQCGVYQYVTCHVDNSGNIALIGVGSAAFIGGMVISLVGWGLRSLVQEPYEIRDTVDAYNKKLKAGAVKKLSLNNLGAFATQTSAGASAAFSF